MKRESRILVAFLAIFTMLAFAPAGLAQTADEVTTAQEELGQTPGMPGTEQPEGTLPTQGFSDVATDAWYANDVQFVVTADLMNGTGNDEFSPELEITRGMIVAVFYRLAGTPDLSSYPNPFSDVLPVLYYAGAVQWAAANGIVSGYDPTTFGPEDNITREQLATIFYRYQQFSGKIPPQGAATTFSDWNLISDYAREAVAALSAQGIINGLPEGSFGPENTATRAEFAAMLQRCLTLLEAAAAAENAAAEAAAAAAAAATEEDLEAPENDAPENTGDGAEAGDGENTGEEAPAGTEDPAGTEAPAGTDDGEDLSGV